MRYTVRPISDRTAFTGKHESSPFRATWSDTLIVLERELDFLRAKEIVLEVDVRERDIRLDGQLRNDAKATSPAVRLAFETRAHGPLIYATDRYRSQAYRATMTDYQHNVRAIALGLEALRKVERYGIATRGEQYTGYKALGAGAGGIAMGGMTADEARRVLTLWSGMPELEAAESSQGQQAYWKRARANTHPDRNDGNRTGWDRVEQAAKVLGLAS